MNGTCYKCLGCGIIQHTEHKGTETCYSIRECICFDCRISKKGDQLAILLAERRQKHVQFLKELDIGLKEILKLPWKDEIKLLESYIKKLNGRLEDDIYVYRRRASNRLRYIRNRIKN